MTDLKKLQEACKLVDMYPDIIEIIINEPKSNQREIFLKLSNKYTYPWVRKVVMQLVDTGLISESSNPNLPPRSEKVHHINEDALQMVKSFAAQYSQLTQK